MKYFIDEKNEVFAFPKDGSLDDLIGSKREIDTSQLSLYCPPLDLVSIRNYNYRKYLNDTDWYVTRLTELGTPIPLDILENRKSARNGIV